MMYFHVPNKKLRVFDNEHNPLEITQESALSFWDACLKKNTHIRLFDDYDNAVKYALFDSNLKSRHQYPIFQVEVMDEEKLSPTEENLLVVSDEGTEETVVETLNSFNTSCGNTKISGLVLNHIRSDLTDIAIETKPLKVKAKEIKPPEKISNSDEETGEINKKNPVSSKPLEIISNANEASFAEVKTTLIDKKKEAITIFKEKEKSDKTSEKATDGNEEKNKPSKETEVKNVKAPSARAKMAVPLAVPLLVTLGGAGFYFSGSYPVVAAFLARAGLVLPFFGVAGVASQVALTGLVGVATYGVGLGLWHFVGAPLVNRFHGFFAKRKTKKESYEEELKKNIAEVSTLEGELGFKSNDEIVVHLSKLLDEAPVPDFDESGDFKDNTSKHKNPLLRWEIEQLNAYKRASNDETERSAVIARIKKGPGF